MATIYLTPQGEAFNPNKDITLGSTQYPAKTFLQADNRLRAGVTTKEVTEPAYDPLTQKLARDVAGNYSVVDMDIDHARRNKYEAVRERYEQEMQAVRGGYSDSEIASWDKQESEARAFVADNAAATPFIDGLAQARGIAKTELVTRIIAKADAATAATAYFTGTKQKLEDDLAAATTNQDLRDVVWPEESA